MRLEKTPENLERMDQKLDKLQKSKDKYHTARNGFVKYNLPGKADNVEAYLGTEVSEGEFMEESYTIVENLVEADKIFERLREAKNAFAELEDDVKVRDRKPAEWQHEINKYIMERRQIVEEIFELSEPVDQSNDFDLDIREEYYERIEQLDHFILEDE